MINIFLFTVMESLRCNITETEEGTKEERQKRRRGNRKSMLLVLWEISMRQYENTKPHNGVSVE